MTRAFLTRHGNGPLEGAEHSITNTDLYDLTNAPNDWQGTLRYAPLDLDILADRIQRDMRRAEITANVQQIHLMPAKVFLTHLDMVGETIHIVRNGELREISTIALRENFLRVGLDVAYASHGPEAKDVHRYRF
jgi:adenylosuccinate synthase